MRKLILIAATFYCAHSFGQQNDDNSAIKLFNNLTYVEKANSSLPDGLAERLYRKTTQLINQTGVAEIGYSTFFIAPKLDVLSVSEDNAGMGKVYLAECELFLSVNRVSFDETHNGGATFNSFSKTINGSGMSKNDAIINAVNSISGNDKDVVAFLQNTKQKISNYFKTNCNDVIKQAERALKINDYSQAIALYFSVPSNAPCYDIALKRSEGVYTKYVEDECNKKLAKIKGYVALGQSNESYYDSAMNIMSGMTQLQGPCYAEAQSEMDKIESKLDEENKQQWELLKKAMSDDTEIRKEKYKAMSDINRNYQPGTNVIITH